MKSLFVTLIFLTGLASCHTGDCFKKKGDKGIQKISLSDIRKLIIKGRVNVEIMNDTSEYAELNWFENYLNFIEIKTTGNTCEVNNLMKCQSLKNSKDLPKVTFHLKNLNEIDYRGAGRISTVNKLSADTFTINCWDGADTVYADLNCNTVYANNHTGISDIRLKGVCKAAYYYNKAMGYIRAFEMHADFIWADNYSPGDIECGPSPILEGNIHYNGNIYYNKNSQLKIVGHAGKGNFVSY